MRRGRDHGLAHVIADLLLIGILPGAQGEQDVALGDDAGHRALIGATSAAPIFLADICSAASRRV